MSKLFKTCFFLILISLFLFLFVFFSKENNNDFSKFSGKYISIDNSNYFFSFDEIEKKVTISSSKIRDYCGSESHQGFLIVNGHTRFSFTLKKEDNLEISLISQLFNSEINDINIFVFNEKEKSFCSLDMPVFIDENTSNFFNVKFISEGKVIDDKFVSEIREKLLNNLVIIPKPGKELFNIKEIDQVFLKFSDDESIEIIFDLIDGEKKSLPVKNDFFWLKTNASFSKGHEFFWDDQFISWFLLDTDDYLVKSTLDFWYDMQVKKGPYEGLIPREIRTSNLNLLDELSDGNLINPVSYQLLGSLNVNNPFIMSRLELLLYEKKDNIERLEEVFPKLVAYFNYIEASRRSNNGVFYFWNDYGAGMDNIARCEFSNCSYIDLVSQQAALASDLQKIAKILGDEEKSSYFQAKFNEIKTIINDNYYNSKDFFYYDLLLDNDGFHLSDKKTIASIWTLYAQVVPEERIEDFVENNFLSNKEFAGDLFFPSISRSSSSYDPLGAYWKGGIWPPMIWLGIYSLSLNQEFKKEADLIASRYFFLFKEIYEQDETLYEYYAPELEDKKIAPGENPAAKKDFFGWGGIPLKLFYYLNCKEEPVNCL